MKITLPKTPLQWIGASLAALCVYASVSAAVTSARIASNPSRTQEASRSSQRDEEVRRILKEGNRGLVDICKQVPASERSASCNELVAKYGD